MSCKYLSAILDAHPHARELLLPPAWRSVFARILSDRCLARWLQNSYALQVFL